MSHLKLIITSYGPLHNVTLSETGLLQQFKISPPLNI